MAVATAFCESSEPSVATKMRVYMNRPFRLVGYEASSDGNSSLDLDQQAVGRLRHTWRFHDGALCAVICAPVHFRYADR